MNHLLRYPELRRNIDDREYRRNIDDREYRRNNDTRLNYDFFQRDTNYNQYVKNINELTPNAKQLINDLVSIDEKLFNYTHQYLENEVKSERYNHILKVVEKSLPIDDLKQKEQNMKELLKTNDNSSLRKKIEEIKNIIGYKENNTIQKKIQTNQLEGETINEKIKENISKRNNIISKIESSEDSKLKLKYTEYNQSVENKLNKLKEEQKKFKEKILEETKTQFSDRDLLVETISSIEKPKTLEQKSDKPFDKFCSTTNAPTNRLTEIDIYNEYEKTKNNPFFTEWFSQVQYNVKKKLLEKGFDRNNFNEKFIRASVEDTMNKKSNYPKITDSNFHEVIHEIFTGKKGPCNFKTQYVIKPDKSSCGQNKVETMSDFHPYQRAVAEYISPFTNYRGLLVYHSVGTGKTINAHGVAANFLKYDSDRTILYVVKPSLVENTYNELKKIDDMVLFGKKLSPDDRKRIMDKRIDVISYVKLANRLAGSIKWDRTVTSKKGYGSITKNTKIKDSADNQLLNNTILIIDEVQNLIKQSDIYPTKGEAAVVLQSILYATDIKLVLLTATPMRDHPDELGALLNLLKEPSLPAELKFPVAFNNEDVELAGEGDTGGKFTIKMNVIDMPKTEKLFEEQFTIVKDGRKTISNQQRFLDLSRGLVSYYDASNDRSRFIKVLNKMAPIEIPMTEKQYETYYGKRYLEIEAMNKNTNFKDQDCSQSIAIKGTSATPMNSCNSSRKYANELKIPKVVKTMERLPGKQFIYTTFAGNGSTLIKLRDELLNSSESWKYLKTDELINMIKPEYRTREAQKRKDWIEKLPENLTSKGEELFSKPNKRFIIYNSEDIDDDFKQRVLLSFFNMEKNIKGDYIKLIIGSSKIKEGISLYGIRGIHFVEYPLSILDLKQIIGRATRDCSHKLLPFDEEHWSVGIYNYIVTYEKLTKMISTDFQQDLLEGIINDVSTNIPAMTGGVRQIPVVDFCESIPIEDCNNVDFCNIDSQSGACSMLNIDDSVKKMAIRNQKLGADFQLLLQVGAIDCELFKEFNQIKDADGKLLKCYKPIDDMSALIDKDLSELINKNESKQFEREDIDCTLFGEDLCLRNPYCYWKPSFIGLYSRCKNRKKGRHYGCSKYYKDETSCNSDNLCNWSESKRGFFSSKTVKSCKEKYDRSLDRYNHSTMLEFGTNQYKLFKLTEVASLDNKDIKGVIKTFKELIQLYGQKHISPNTQLEILQNLIITDQKNEYINYSNEIKEAILKDQKAYLNEWLLPKVDNDLQQFLKFYDNLTIMNSKKSLNKKHYFMVSWEEKKSPDLYTLSKKQTKLSYVMKFMIDEYTYYISSLEIKDACLSLHDIEHLSSTTKIFQGNGLFLTVIFYFKQGRLIRITYETVPNDTVNTDQSCSTFWTLSSSNEVVVPLKENECSEFWDRNMLGAPPNIESLDNFESKLQAKECWLKWKNKQYNTPLSFNIEQPQNLIDYCNKVVTSKEECSNDDECWNEMTSKDVCSKIRKTDNPFKCERRFPVVWTKKCYLKNEEIKGGKKTMKN